MLSEFALGEAGWAAVAVGPGRLDPGRHRSCSGCIFRYLADVRLAWREVLFGSAVTAVLFKVGQYLQALYFTYGSTASTYGAAGSFVVVLLWVYYSCWVLFYGAELIQERVRRQGREIAPDANAEKLTGDERAPA